MNSKSKYLDLKACLHYQKTFDTGDCKDIVSSASQPELTP
jgi:hypothetical protein